MKRPMLHGFICGVIFSLAFHLASCGIRDYHWASYGPGDTSAGDVTHASDSGARVVVPNKLPDPPRATYRVVETPEGGRALLNDLRFTPGEIRTTNRALVCSESTKTIRKPGLQEVYVLYGATKKPGICCEIDHLISLELGGANTLQNEWPQPYEPRPGAHEKDEVENWLHKQVCEGTMPLESAQNRIATNWYAVYQEMQKGKQ